MANRYSVGCKLGSGAFGTAFLITDTKSSNDRYARSTAHNYDKTLMICAPMSMEHSN